MPTDSMSLEDIKIQREAMQKKIEDIEKKLEDSLKERKDLQASNSALILSMELVMKQAEKQKQQLAEEIKEDKARLEDEICKLKLTVQALSSAQEDCEIISDAQEDCESISHAQEDRESISDASRATSKVTMISTIHSRKRLAKHNISRREVQSVIKHGGEGFLQENGNRRISHDGTRVILDKDEPRVVTTHREGPAVRGHKAAELERQKAADLEKERVAELERQQVAELEKEQAAELERQKAAELEQERTAELERQQVAELEKQKAAELEQQKAAELEKEKAAELVRQQVAELTNQQASELENQKAAELEKQKAAELEKQKAAELEKQKAAELEKQKAAELEKQKAAELVKEKVSTLKRTASLMDPELAQKSGQAFLQAQVACLSETAKKAHKEIEVHLKEDIEFTPSSSKLTDKGKRIVKKVFGVLEKHPTMIIRVEGHTGCKCIAGGGTPKRGQKCKAVELSDDRAASVIEHLKGLGCKNDLKSRGHGCIYRVGMAVKVFPAAGQ